LNKLKPISGSVIPVEPHNMHLQLLTYGGFPLLIIVVGLMLRGVWLAWMKFKAVATRKSILCCSPCHNLGSYGV